ncbi:hypothetical protein LG329_17220 [Virgibacillus necropolis]|uniref:hypothetical protein n=1 Tax=Virgibacillus necropolis TaxID=163877 RepID=UPI00384BFBD4
METKDQTADTEKETIKKDRDAEESINNEPDSNSQSAEEKVEDKKQLQKSEGEK